MMNPQFILQQMLGGDMRQKIENSPVVQNAISLNRSNDINGLKQIAENLCQNKGINLQDAQNQLMHGVKFMR